MVPQNNRRNISGFKMPLLTGSTGSRDFENHTKLAIFKDFSSSTNTKLVYLPSPMLYVLKTEPTKSVLNCTSKP